MSFENIIGNDKIKVLLNDIINSNNVLHSYMFLGIEGIGKKLFALEFAKMILCTEKNKPCEKCKSCIEMNSNNNPDFNIVEPQSGSIKIEQIRLLQSKIIEKPIISNKKVYVINDCELMTKEAQNCLLKTLEEPPEFAVIILICSNENLLLNTIKSRCTKINFNKLCDSEIEEYFNKYEISDISLNSSVISNFGGSIKKAIEFNKNIELYDKINSLFENIDNMNIIEILNSSEVLYKNKDNINEILEYINTIVFNKLTKDNNKNYLNCITIIEDTKRKLKVNSNFDMSIDSMLFRIWEELNK